MIIRILILNAGLLKFPGGFEAAPQVEARAKALGSEIRSMNADIVLLQEIYKRRHCERLCAELRDLYPSAAYDRHRLFGFPNTLVTLARYEMSASLKLFRSAPAHEKLFDRKGALLCRFNLGSSTHLAVLNIHTTAGGPFLHPESPLVERIRAQQICEIIRITEAEEGIVIVAGDLNAGPDTSRQNFQSMLDANFVSVHDWVHPHASDPTWDPSNRLNANGPHRICPPQRIDHVFVQRSDIERGCLRPLKSYVCLKEEGVIGRDGLMCSVSDHFGLSVELEITE